MNILKEAIVSNSDMIKNYKASRDKAEILGKLFIFKNNQPDAVLLSIKEYERIAVLVEYLDNLDEQNIEKLMELLPIKID